MDKALKLKLTARAALGLGGYLLLSNLLLVATVAAANLLRFGKLGLDSSALSEPAMILAETAVMVISFLVGIAIMARYLPDPNMLERPGKGGGIYFGLFFAAIYAGAYLSTFLSMFFSNIGVTWQPFVMPEITGLGTGAIAVIRYIIAPAVLEELLFRGALLRTLLPLGERGACLAVSVLFMVFHYNAAQWPAIFLLGFALTSAAIKTGSVVPSIIMHLVNNLFAFAQNYLLAAGMDTAVQWLSITISALGIGGAVFYFTARRYNPDSARSKTEAGAAAIFASPLLAILIFGVLTSALSARIAR